MSDRDPSLHVLQHALGLDDYGRDKRGRIPADVEEPYRNRYVIGPDGDAWRLCMAHVEAGLMTRRDECQSWTGGMSCFCVTAAGLEHVRANSPKAPKVSRSKRRYERWLDISDVTGQSFGEWLKAGGT
jgi:hypothetical protein